MSLNSSRLCFDYVSKLCSTERAAFDHGLGRTTPVCAIEFDRNIQVEYLNPGTGIEILGYSLGIH